MVLSAVRQGVPAHGLKHWLKDGPDCSWRAGEVNVVVDGFTCTVTIQQELPQSADPVRSGKLEHRAPRRVPHGHRTVTAAGLLLTGGSPPRPPLVLALGHRGELRGGSFGRMVVPWTRVLLWWCYRRRPMVGGR